MIWLDFLFLAVTCHVSGISASPAVVPVAAGQGHSAGSLQQLLCSGDSAALSSTTLMLGAGEHSFQGNAPCRVADVGDLTILGGGVATIVCTDELMGLNFIFLNVTNLTIGGVSMENCGRVLPQALPSYVNNTMFYFDTEQKVAVLFARVMNLVLFDVWMTQSFGFGIIGINLQGDVELHNVSITDTDNYRHPLCFRNETGLGCSGSGAEFLYSDPNPDDEHDFLPAPTTLTIRNCSFLNNENFVPTARFIPVFLSFRGAFMLDRLLITGATGLGMYFGQRYYDVDVSIASSSISYNRGYASGLAFLLFNTIRNVHVELEDCIVRGNEGSNLARGGGMLMLVIMYISELSSLPEYPTNDIHNVLLIQDTTIADNFANIGGGCYFFFAPQNISDYSITFDNVTFVSNRAMIGTALEADTRPTTFVQKTIHLLLIDVTASDNTLPMSTVTTASENSAAFVILNVMNVTLVGKNHTQGSLFVNNSPAPFLVVGGHLYLKGKIEFTNNTGSRGGALMLYDYALLFIHEGSRITFAHNYAKQVGGAIFASSPGTGTAPTCVFQVIGSHRVFSVQELDQLDLSMKFIGNSAVDGGNSVYVNPLYGCASLPESSLVDISVVFDSTVFYNALFQFESPVSNGLSEISSVPEHVCLCQDGAILSPQSLCTSTDSHEVTVVPGERFTLKLFPVDLVLNPVSSILLVSVNSRTHTLARGQTSFRLFGGKCTTVDLNVYGPENSSVSLALHTQQGSLPFLVDITMRSCPPGFLSGKPSDECRCDPYIEVIGSSCNFTNYTVLRQSNSWLGTIEHMNFSDVVYVFTCPIGFCNNYFRYVDLTVADQLCQPGRTGILCGACHSNLSVVFGSAECMKCSNFWLFTIFLYAAAGIVLIGFLFLLNFTVSQGSLNGISIIFYVNLVSVNSNLLFSSDNRGFLFIWVSLLNLELGFPLCLYDGMTEAVKAGLQCVFPLYLLCMSLGLIILSRWSRRVAKLVSSHGIQVLTTLVYLSFSKMLRYVIDILSFATLRSEERNRIIWLFDGNLEYFTGVHAVIVVLPAAVTLFFIVIYTSSLVFIRQLERCTIKLKPLLDAYGGPFKDRFRFWFGLRLLVLIAMCLAYALIGTDDPVQAVVIQQVFLVLFMVLQAFVRPFRIQLMNALDLFYMLNLFFLLLHAVTVLPENTLEQRRVVNSLLSVSFIMFLFLMLYHMYCIPIIKAKLGPKVKKLKQISWSDIQTAVCAKCRKEDTTVAKTVTLNSMHSIDPVDVREGRTSTTEISLENSLDADKVFAKRMPTFSRFRESSLDFFS